MLDALFRLAPSEVAGPVFLAGLAWGGVHYMAVAPEIGTRLAELQHIPRCEAHLNELMAREVADQESLRARILAERARIVAEAEARLARQRAKAAQAKASLALLTEGPMGELTALIDPEGKLRAGMGGLVPDLPELDLEALNLPELPPLPAPPAPDLKGGQCACATREVLAANRLDLALHTASLTVYRPPVVSGFASLFAPLLYTQERFALWLGPALLLVPALRLGVLTLEYRGLGGSGQVIGNATRLARVRAAIDNALEARGAP